MPSHIEATLHGPTITPQSRGADSQKGEWRVRNEEQKPRMRGRGEPGGRSTGWSALLCQSTGGRRACCYHTARLPGSRWSQSVTVPAALLRRNQRRCGMRQNRTPALLLLVCFNVCFFLSYGLWVFGMHYMSGLYLHAWSVEARIGCWIP